MLRLVSVLLFVVLAQGATAQSLLDVSQKPWNPLPGDLRARFIAATGLEKGLKLQPAYLTLQEQPLSWSEGSHLVRVLGGWEPRSLVLYFVLRADGGIIHLDGSYKALAALNASVPPKITPDTVADYVWFSGFFVRSGNDPFLVVETPQDRYLPDLLGDARPRKLACRRADAANSGFRCEGTVYHAAALYSADFEITTDGTIDIPESQRLASNLAPVNAPIDPRNYPGFKPFP